MRIIILNTLGESFQPNPLFFLPFREDELIWVHWELSALSDSAEEISGRLGQLSTRERYHLILLADLSVFPGSEYDNMRQACRDLLSAWFHYTVLKPLSALQVQLPSAITEIYLYSGTLSGDRGIPDSELYAELFQLKKLSPASNALEVCCHLAGHRLRLDFAPLFARELEDYQKAVQTPEESPGNARADRKASAPHQDALLPPKRMEDENEAIRKKRLQLQNHKELLEMNIRNRIRQMLTYELSRVGKQDVLVLDTERLYFPIHSDGQEQSMADLQINLSQMAEQLSHWTGQGKPPAFSFQVHSLEELTELFHRSELRLYRLLHQLPEQTFYPLDAGDLPVKADRLQGEIRRQLAQEHPDLMGVREALKNTDAGEEWEESLPGRLRKAWLRLGLERKQFLSLFQLLQNHYDEAYVSREQEQVLNTCLHTFQRWRKETLDHTADFVPRQTMATELRMPELSDALAEIQGQLDENQKQYTKAAAAHLELYEDVREEGLRLRSEFEQKSRFWAPDAFARNLPNFRRFSGVMAVIFLILMVLPFALIERYSWGSALPKSIALLVSLGWFAFAYGIGLLIWLRQMCRQLHGLSVELYQLLGESAEKRAKSVQDQIEVYGRLLPKCVRLTEQQNMLRQIDRENRKKADNRIRHEELLTQALTGVQNLRTSLRISPPVQPLSPEEEQRLTLALDQSPWEGANRSVYLLFSK